MAPFIKARKTTPGTITLVLSQTDNPESLQSVMQLTYGELRDVAVRESRKWKLCYSLHPTSLVHESCARLLQSTKSFKNRRYFFGAAARSMRQVLVDHARRRKSLKRGGDLQRVDFTYAEQIGFERPSDLLDFDSALSRLEAAEPRWSQVAELHVFGGYSIEEVAVILNCGKSTARSRWTNAKKWLASDLAPYRRAGFERAEEQ